MKPSGRRRGFRSWFVEPYRQVKLGLLFLLLNLAFAGLTLGIFGYYVWDIYQAMATYFHLTSDQGQEILQKFQTPLMAGGALVFVFVVMSILIAVRYTYRIYGPLVSIHRFLDELQQGMPITPLILRESDQLQGLAEKLNRLAEQERGAGRKTSSLTPVYRYLDDIIAGKQPEPIRLREYDEYHSLAERLNRLGEQMRRDRAG